MSGFAALLRLNLIFLASLQALRNCDGHFFFCYFKMKIDASHSPVELFSIFAY